MYISMDLDDTLLHTDKSISDMTLNVLRKCQELGHIIIINTARNRLMTWNLMNTIKPDFTIINAGVQIFDKNMRMVYDNPLSEEIVNIVVNKIKSHCEYLSIQSYDNLFSTNPLNTNPDAKYLDISNGCFIKAHKILPYKIDFDYANKIAKEMNLEYVKYFRGNWSRFSNHGMTKLFGLKWIVEKTNGKMEDTISFGDDHGDIEMLLGSKIGVAMENSQQEVLDCVSEKTISNNLDGVAIYLKKLFNI